MPTRTSKLVVALITTCFCATVTAAMYRWVDENGVTIYSQSPPPTGETITIRKQPAPRAEDAKAAQERTTQQREQVFDEGEARREAATEQAKKIEEEKRRATNCETARSNLEKLQNMGRRKLLTPDGQALRLTEDQLRTRIEKAQTQVEEFCK